MPGTLEHIVSATNHPYTFIDIRYRENERGNSWMFERTIANYEVMIPMLLEPRQHMESFLLIDKVRMPKYLP
ncbi:hypothetical protein MH117_20350 [Paenibacillus sp. ACRRX]|uniref:hypothetical protein n=1 Tax=Paenibacillus sp. ACRRX TaxID=2918206 RepID=UPI001EF3E012|nr:hypothetical protein [Paenibacillus sp. ACRRX]MCG7409761.1 hypothetical protein [Paenibacillus sp. ACRRX]